MMKKITVSIAILMATVTTAQMGIHTKKPKATLEVVATTDDGRKPEGILIPRLTGDSALKMLNNLSDKEHSMLIFVKSPATTNQSKEVLSSPGYYRYEYNAGTTENPTKTWIPLEPSGLQQVLIPNGQDPKMPSYRLISKNSPYLRTENLGEGAIDMTFQTTGNEVGATGKSSVALGKDSKASEEGAFALGGGVASGYNSFSFGEESKAFGNYSFAFGGRAIARGIYSVSFGGTASGYESFSINQGTASGHNAISLGGEAKGKNSLSLGKSSAASGDESIAFLGGTAINLDEIAFGTNFSTDAIPFPKSIDQRPPEPDKYQLFSIGTTVNYNYKDATNFNALVILRDGSMGIAIPKDTNRPANSKPTEKLDVNGTARLRGINPYDGNREDNYKIVIADRGGVLKTIQRSNIVAEIEGSEDDKVVVIDKKGILKSVSRNWFEKRKNTTSARPSRHNKLYQKSEDTAKIKELSSRLEEQEKKLHEKNAEIEELKAKSELQETRLQHLESFLLRS